MPAFDLYWFFWDVLPTGWMKHFNIVQYLFLLLPGTLVCYAVSSYISTNVLELQYYLILRYMRIRKWLARSLADIAFLCGLILLLFHSGFLLTAWALSANNGSAISLYSGQRMEPLVFLCLRQIVFVAMISSIQLIVSVRRNLQSGIVFFLAVFETALLYDMVFHQPFRFCCSSAWSGNIIWPFIVYLAILTGIVIKTHKSKFFFCKGVS